MSAEENRVLVLAPVGQDAEALASLLRGEGVPAEACTGAGECLELLESGAGAVLLTEEALELAGAEGLLESFRRQPAWSELPLIVLTSGGESRLARVLGIAAEVAGAVTLLERPIGAGTLLQSVQVALRSRRRQYAMRDLLEERERAAEALRGSEMRARRQFEELEAIYRTAPVGLCVFDRDLRYRRINERLAEINGVAAEEHIGKTVREVVPSLAEQAEKVLRRVMETGRPVHFEFAGQTRAQPGVQRVWDELWFPVWSETGGVEGVGVVAQDITERKAFQAELQRSVDERTAALRDMVGELEHFSYSITHDMRAPLRAMMGFAEVVKELCSGSGNEQQKVFLERIQTAARRMDLLITDALNYSKAVRSELPLAPMDVGRLLRGMVDTYPELQDAQGGIVIEPELPVVMGNEAGLTQCFSNLLVNAVKFVKPGEAPQIRVWAQEGRSEARGQKSEHVAAGHQVEESRSKPGSGWVRIWVEDKGVGISKNMLPRVFHMFVRGASKQAGTGIGLALVRKVVERMGGRVGVESEEGRGSRFWVELRSGDLRPRVVAVKEGALTPERA